MGSGQQPNGRPAQGGVLLGTATLAPALKAPSPCPLLADRSCSSSAVTIVAHTCLIPHLPLRRPGEVAKPVFMPAPARRVRALRGATTVDEDDYYQVTTRTIALVRAMVEQQWARP